jgi:hypothetical protein
VGNEIATGEFAHDIPRYLNMGVVPHIDVTGIESVFLRCGNPAYAIHLAIDDPIGVA